jgi:hypothetical protein
MIDGRCVAIPAGNWDKTINFVAAWNASRPSGPNDTVYTVIGGGDCRMVPIDPRPTRQHHQPWHQPRSRPTRRLTGSTSSNLLVTTTVRLFALRYGGMIRIKVEGSNNKTVIDVSKPYSQWCDTRTSRIPSPRL